MKRDKNMKRKSKFKMSLTFSDYTHAALAAIKFIPFFHENHNGLREAVYSEKHMSFYVWSFNADGLRVIWENPSQCQILEETNRLYAFAAIMFAFIEFKKVNKTQIELIENYKDRVFELCVNQITVFKCHYKTIDTKSITQFTTIRDSIIANPTVNRVSQQKAQETAAQMIAIYNSITIPPELNTSTNNPDDEFKSYDRISIWTEKIDFPEITPNGRSKNSVGVALAKTSDRFDRFDHDD